MSMQFTPDGRLAPDPVWCQKHRFEEDYHWTNDVVAWWPYVKGNDRFELIDSWGPCPVGRECAAASVARGDTDSRAITEWRG